MVDEKHYSYPVGYDGNILWPILFLILFFPVGILLLIFNGTLRIEGTRYKLHYKGSEGWLIFWTIVFFPVAIVLALIRGFDAVGVKE